MATASEPQANCLPSARLAIVGVDLATKSPYLAAPGAGLLPAYRLVALFPFLHGDMFYLYVRPLTTGRGFALRDTVHVAGYALVLAMTVPLLLVSFELTSALFAHWSADQWPSRWFNPFLYAYSLSCVVAAAQWQQTLAEHGEVFDASFGGCSNGSRRWLVSGCRAIAACSASGWTQHCRRIRR